ncbi:hypothetical protein BKA69DRAFT_1103200 [Paraphysoderma sedebokerense]|nr:hypothetical protein BKA69DRAFT_1103200 [Paraphysoderma sedebokerense]
MSRRQERFKMLNEYRKRHISTANAMMIPDTDPAETNSADIISDAVTSQPEEAILLPDSVGTVVADNPTIPSSILSSDANTKSQIQINEEYVTASSPVTELPTNSAVPQPTHRLAFETFNIFDTDKSGCCDVREVGTILRAMNLFPSEVQLKELITRMTEPEAPIGRIRYTKFQEVVTPLLINNTMARDDEDTLHQAFLVLDKDKKGYLTGDELKDVLTQIGEQFNAAEMEEMLMACPDSKDGKFYYEDYVMRN